MKTRILDFFIDTTDKAPTPKKPPDSYCSIHVGDEEREETEIGEPEEIKELLQPPTGAIKRRGGKRTVYLVLLHFIVLFF